MKILICWRARVIPPGRSLPITVYGDSYHTVRDLTQFSLDQAREEIAEQTEGIHDRNQAYRIVFHSVTKLDG